MTKLRTALALVAALFIPIAAQPVDAQQTAVSVFDTAQVVQKSVQRDPLVTRTILTPISISAEQQRQHYAQKGALIGGLALGAVASVVGYSWCAGDNEAASDNCFATGMGWFLMGTVPGSIFGGLIGYAITRKLDD